MRNRAQRSSSGCGWALVQMAVGPMHASKTCNAKRSRTRWRSRRAPPPLSPLSQEAGLPWLQQHYKMLGLLLLAYASALATSMADSPPNVIIIVADDVSFFFELFDLF